MGLRVIFRAGAVYGGIPDAGLFVGSGTPK